MDPLLKVEYCAVLFLTVSLADSLQQLDIDIFRGLNGAGSNDLLDLLMVLFTVAGFSYVIVLLCVPLWVKGRRELAFDVVVLVILTTVLVEAIKAIVDRPRPMNELDDVKTIISASGPSFPSAHAARAFAVATIVSFGGSRSVVTSAFASAALIAISRVYLGVHWPSDVLAGAMLGIGVAAVVRWFGQHSDGYCAIRRRVIEGVIKLRFKNRGSKRTS